MVELHDAATKMLSKSDRINGSPRRNDERPRGSKVSLLLSIEKFER